MSALTRNHVSPPLIPHMGNFELIMMLQNYSFFRPMEAELLFFIITNNFHWYISFKWSWSPLQSSHVMFLPKKHDDLWSIGGQRRRGNVSFGVTTANAISVPQELSKALSWSWKRSTINVSSSSSGHTKYEKLAFAKNSMFNRFQRISMRDK